MQVEIIVRAEGRDVKRMETTVEGSAEHREEQCHQIGREVGRCLTESSLNELAEGRQQPPRCCGVPMRRKGLRGRTVTAWDGEIRLRRRRYRCRECGRECYPGDDQITCGRHGVTRPLAKRLCQLATTEHFTQLPQLAFDQHGVQLSGEALHQLATDVGSAADCSRRAEVEAWRQTPPRSKRWPEPDVPPKRIYVSCDGICYCTNQSEPDPAHPGGHRLLWQEMKVGCVYWQDDNDRWHKRMTWGREPPQEFGQALYLLACRCGYRQAEEKIFAADGAEWCWTIQQNYFVDAVGILDWFHASEHVWEAARIVGRTEHDVSAWANQALQHMADGGCALVNWLDEQKRPRRGKARQAIEKLARYLRPRFDRMDYPEYRKHDFQIGTGMIESTAKQLVGMRLKGPGMHWSERGALAITALRAHSLNNHWHQFWNHLTLTP